MMRQTFGESACEMLSVSHAIAALERYFIGQGLEVHIVASAAAINRGR